MKNWIELNDQEQDKVWDYFDKNFYKKSFFKPRSTNYKFGSFIPPKPFITYDISSIWGATDHNELYFDLETKYLECFKELTKQDEYFYALDWQHECYWVNAFLEFPIDELNRWIIPAVPDGDFYFFINNNFKWGILSHPWEKTITVFGKEILEVMKDNKPTIFHTILRKS